MNEELIRAGFEKSRLEILGVLDQRQNSDGSYFDAETQKDWLLWQAALRAESVPDGWKLVPFEITPDMIWACSEQIPFHMGKIEPAYKAMLAATPQVPTDDERVRELENKYNELIMAVASKFPNETRHETALRYIRNAESSAVASCLENRNE